RPVRTSSMTTVVVAITFVSEARSNGVWMTVGREAGSKLSVPSASDQMTDCASPTSIAAAGKVRAPIDFSITRRASSSDTAHHETDTHADRRTRQHVPGPRERREDAHGDHR